MGKGGSSGGGQITQQTPNQVITPDRNQVLSEGQRVVDNHLGDFVNAFMNAGSQSYGHTPMQLYPLHNYQATQFPTFNPQAYYQQFASSGQGGYGPGNLNQVQPFGLRSAGRPYNGQSPTQGVG